MESKENIKKKNEIEEEKAREKSKDDSGTNSHNYAVELNQKISKFLDKYFKIALKNLDILLFSELKQVEKMIITSYSLTFWLNFALNFSDRHYVNFIKSNFDSFSENLMKILSKIYKFLLENTDTKEQFFKKFKWAYLNEGIR